jgi:hypothetical protein
VEVLVVVEEDLQDQLQEDPAQRDKEMPDIQ